MFESIEDNQWLMYIFFDYYYNATKLILYSAIECCVLRVQVTGELKLQNCKYLFN